MASYITFTGGTAQQQQAIRDAHDALTVIVPEARDLAAQRGGPFSVWFGTGSEAPVRAAYDAVATGLAGASFWYDLTDSPTILLVPAGCVLFLDYESNGVTAQVWEGFWTNYYLDRRRAGLWLAGSIVHEAVLAFASEVMDYWQVDSVDSASALAASSPTAAVRCAVNLEGYVVDLLDHQPTPHPGGG